MNFEEKDCAYNTNDTMLFSNKFINISVIANIILMTLRKKNQYWLNVLFQM